MNSIMRKLSGHNRDEVIERWRQQGNEEFHKLYCSLNITMVIKSRLMWWMEHMARMRTRGMRTKF